jgi:hypothetical protein
MRFPFAKTARNLLALASVAILVALALVAFTVQNQTNQSANQQERARTTMAGLPPFANSDFDVSVTPAIVTVAESGGSVGVHVVLKATKLTSSETLVLETHASIPGYLASFNPTSVTLHPGDSIGIELTVTIPSGVQNGAYPMSIVARGGTTEGGTWLVIVIGPSQTVPPP